MDGDTYLFIDGEYLRQIHRQAMLDFFGVDGELDILEAKREAGALRAFFYDSIDEGQRPGETVEACRERTAPLHDFMNRTSALSGVHVRLGTVTGKRRRQKEVDILLATDMLTHGFNGSMKNAVLLSGDLGITIRLDDEILAWFRNQVELAGGGNYQTVINEVLRQHIQRAQEPLEKTLRRVIREEIRRAS